MGGYFCSCSNIKPILFYTNCYFAKASLDHGFSFSGDVFILDDDDSGCLVEATGGGGLARLCLIWIRGTFVGPLRLEGEICSMSPNLFIFTANIS